MSLVTYKGLKRLLDSGAMRNFDPDNINGASIDVRLGEGFLIENAPTRNHTCDLANKVGPEMIERPIQECGGVILPPGGVVLAHTMEFFDLPDNIAIEFKLKSSIARGFLGHMLAGWGDPGWHGSQLTLELKNELRHHNHLLRPGMKIGQVVFWEGEPVPASASYSARGRYNNTEGAVMGKGV